MVVVCWGGGGQGGGRAVRWKGREPEGFYGGCVRVACFDNA